MSATLGIVGIHFLATVMLAAEQAAQPCLTRCDLRERDGQIVSFRARNSNHPEQHPGGRRQLLLDGSLQEVVSTYIELVEAGTLQIVLTSPRRIECPDVMRVIGQVDVVDLGGPRGTKREYNRPWIRVISYRCE